MRRSTSQLSSHAHQRQGFCHVSQLLELLFAKYGISTEIDDHAETNDPIFAAAKIHAAEVMKASPAVTSVSAVQQDRCAQTTFAWFEPAELTV